MGSKRSGKLSTLTSSPSKGPGFLAQARGLALGWLSRAGKFLRQHWIGTVFILAATIVFFWPLIIHIGSYSPGGDAMFNAWEMRRNQNCILRQHCPEYKDANIYYPHADTMLYSETQLSAGVVTLPLYWLSQNPIFAYNLLTILCFFLSGWFMYLLAKYLSKGNEFISTLSGLVFAYAPLKIAAIHHLQNLSIFCLPLAVLLILRFFDLYVAPKVKARRLARKRALPVLRIAQLRQWRVRSVTWVVSVYKASLPGKKYIIGLFLALLYVFFASWVQMVFVLIALGVVLVLLWALRLVTVRPLSVVVVTIGLAAFTTLPLALQYVQFSKQNGAPFSMHEQILYSADVKDYSIPNDGTLLGKLYYHARPGAARNGYNPDSFSYHGMSLYAVVIVVAVLAYKMRKLDAQHKKRFTIIVAFVALAVVGFVISLGPVLKVYGQWAHSVGGSGTSIAIMLPWAFVDAFLPQLSFIRAVGRASVLVLFALCCLLAFLPLYIDKMKWVASRKRLVYGLIAVLLVIELAPVRMIPMSQHSYAYTFTIPPVYTYVKDHPAVDNIVIIHGDSGYPNEEIPIARAEWVLWAGYHNKNIFNGYSGYEPKDYLAEYIDFKDLDAHDLVTMRKFGLQYVIIDKQLSAGRPELIQRARGFFPKKLYEDKRYALFKIPD